LLRRGAFDGDYSGRYAGDVLADIQ